MNGNNTGPKVAIGCGGILLFFAFCAAAFGAFHVFVDPHGHISADEAMPALIGGVLCMLVDFLIIVAGIALLMRGGSGAAQGAVASGGGGGAVQGPGAPAAQGGAPWHFATGCGALFFLVTSCLSLSGAVYSYSEVERWESMRSSDIAAGEDPLILMIDDHAVEENTEYTGAGACCCGLSFLLLLACAGGTAVLVRRRGSSS